MVFPIVSPSDSRGPWFVQTWICTTLEGFCVNLSFSAFVVLEKIFLNDPTQFLHFCDYLSFDEDLALDLYNFRFPLPKNGLYQVWLKLAFSFWRRGSYKIVIEYLLFRYYIPLGKGVVLHFYNFESHFPKDDLWQLWLKLVQRLWRRSWKCKSLTDRRTTDNRRSEKLKAQVS
jgi:hypothetical protein